MFNDGDHFVCRCRAQDAHGELPTTGERAATTQATLVEVDLSR